MRNGRTWVVDSVLLFAFTVFLLWPWFRLEYSANWGSIESTFIADGRFLRDNLPHPQWQPNWYCGTRFDYIYPPALRYGTALISKAFDVSTARSYHWYTGFFFAVGIVATYVFVRVGSGYRLLGYIAGLGVLTMSPSLLFLKHFRAEYGSSRNFPVRLGVLVRYGEGPHMTAFALLPLAFAGAWIGLRKGRPVPLLLGAVAAAAAVSNNFYGATALALTFPILTWAVYLHEKQDWRVFVRAAVFAVLSYGFTAFWLVPSYVRVTLRNMKLVSQPGNAWSAYLLAGVLVVFAVLSWRLARGRPERAWPVFAMGTFAVFTLTVLGHYYFGFRVLGEPERLVPEFDCFFIIVGTVALGALWQRGVAAKWLAIGLVVLAIYPVKGWVRRSWQYFPAPADYHQRIEYQLTKYIHDNLPGQRVLSMGSLRFWYNAWYDLPETGGGSEQGTLNMISVSAYFAVAYMVPAADVIAWMQAVGTDAFVLHDQRSEEVYKDVTNAHVYDGRIPVIYDDGKGNRIFEIPRKQRHIARVVNRSEVMALAPHQDGAVPMETVHAYAKAMEQGPDAPIEFTREGLEGMRVKTTLGAGQAVTVLESFDPAWRAYSASGQRLPISYDPMGFMLVDAPAGPQEITLRFETPPENRVGQALTVATLLFYAGAAVELRRRRRLS
ncbi:MAG: hypothetical protein IT168_05650 [Bryobacterales bacterium]|nr:hypothetical protein [Bryobacterales bacterium]